MYNDEATGRRFYAVRHEEETATICTGSLIPNGHFLYTPSAIFGATVTKSASHFPSRVSYRLSALLIVCGILTTVVSVSVDHRQLIAALTPLPSAPQVVITHPYTNEQTPLNYGINVTFSEPNFFNEARNAFIDAEQSFIEANLSTMQLRYFENGVLRLQAPILSKGQRGSWRETPAGLYNIEQKNKKLPASAEQSYLPWSIGFQGNYFIHATPIQANADTNEKKEGGGIRLSDEDAEQLYHRVSIGTPIIVYEERPANSDFLYEPKIPDIATPHYLIADVESSTVLASSDLSAVAPIASITKLMTAIIAAEYLNLDSSITVSAPAFIQSLVPRLGERTRASMYSLLQLLLVESSNEAAEVIAAELGRAEFIARMNEKAQAIGMTDTVFDDPSGLSSNNVSTVRDLFRLLQHIYQHRRFIIDISREQNLAAVYVGGEFGQLTNFNRIKGTDNFVGGKIGETNAAGQTSATLHTLRVKGVERTVAIIILGSQSRNEDVLQLLTYAEERFSD